MASHLRSGLATFGDGETRLVFARPAEGGELFWLPDGEARELREWTKSALLCPVPDCDSPKLTTVSRAHARDGFRHTTRGAGTHAPESLFHLQAKEVVARWLRDRHPRSTVEVEHGIDGERVADVMLTAPTGERVAFEIQYSGLSVQAWRERHQFYADRRIQDIWLWGHYGTFVRPAGQDVRLNAVQRETAGAGLQLLWINPIRAELAVAADVAPSAEGPVQVPHLGSRLAELAGSPLNEFNVTRSGVDGPALRRLGENLALARAWAEQLQRDGRWGGGPDRERIRNATVSGTAQDSWDGSERRAEMLALYGGVWPTKFDVRTAWGLIVPAAEWQSWAWEEVIHPIDPERRIDERVVSKLLAQKFERGAREAPRIVLAVQEWFDALVEYDLLRKLDLTTGDTEISRGARDIYFKGQAVKSNSAG